MRLSTDSDIFRCARDVDGFRLDRHPPLDPKFDGQLWERVSPARVVRLWDVAQVSEARKRAQLHLLSFLPLFEGEREQRHTIERNLAKGRRNIALLSANFRRAMVETVELLLHDKEREFYLSIKTRIAKKASVSTEARARYKQLLARIKDFEKDCLEAVRRLIMIEHFGLPVKSDAELAGYEIDEQVLALAIDEECRKYLVSQQGTQRDPIFGAKMARIESYLREHYGTAAKPLIERIKNNRVNPFSSLSLTSEKDKLLVTIVNPHGRHVRVEAWKFLKAVQEKGQTQKWGPLVRKGYDEPEPLVRFNDRHDGVLYGKLWPERYCIEVLCRPESEGEDGPKINATVHDQSWFYIEPEYLACVAHAIERLMEDRKRFNDLMEQAQTVVVSDPLAREPW